VFSGEKVSPNEYLCRARFRPADYFRRLTNWRKSSIIKNFKGSNLSFGGSIHDRIAPDSTEALC